jgi:hypothetical protein
VPGLDHFAIVRLVGLFRFKIPAADRAKHDKKRNPEREGFKSCNHSSTLSRKTQYAA